MPEKDFKKDPLWIKAQEAMQNAADELISATDLYRFDEEERDVAAVVLAYYNHKPVSELKRFIQKLSETACKYDQYTIVNYKYGSSVERSEAYAREAESYLNELWEKKNRKVTQSNLRKEKAQERNNRGNASKQKLSALDFFKRFLNL